MKEKILKEMLENIQYFNGKVCSASDKEYVSNIIRNLCEAYKNLKNS